MLYGSPYGRKLAPVNGQPVIRWSPAPDECPVVGAVQPGRGRGRLGDERQRVKQFLSKRLSAGPRAARKIWEEAVVNCMSLNTLRRAFRELGCRATREGPLPRSPWLWQLPGTDSQKSGGDLGYLSIPRSIRQKTVPARP
jgi:hypothetical protein